MDEATCDLLRRAQDLLGHRVAPGDLAAVFGRALKAYVEILERAKFAATERPRTQGRPAKTDTRYISAAVKREVWIRDGGQCTYTSESGHRCEARSDLEYDHVAEFARGGETTARNLRLRCRAHNQYTAEQTFGAGFMQAKREEAKAAAERRRVERAKEKARRESEREQRTEESRLQPGLRQKVPLAPSAAGSSGQAGSPT